MVSVVNFLQDAYGAIIFTVVVISLLSWKYRSNKKKVPKKKLDLSERKVELVPEKTTFNEYLFGESNSLLGSLKKQKDRAMKEIVGLEKEGIKVKKEEADLENNYIQQTAIIAQRKDAIGFQHTTWTKQLRAIEVMISNQEDMEMKLKE